MITFKTEIRSFDVPNSYNDLTVRQMFDLIEAKDNEERIIFLLTGLNLAEAAFIDFNEIMKYLSFLKESPYKLESSNYVKIDDKDFLIPEDIGSGSWGSKIIAAQSYNENKPLRMLSAYLQPIYDDSDLKIDRLEQIEKKLLDLKVSDVYPAINHVAAELKRWKDIEKKLFTSKPTPEQIRAGIDMFNQLGEFNTIDMIAGGDVTKYNEVLKVDYSSIFNKLVKINLTAIFERNYNEILRE